MGKEKIQEMGEKSYLIEFAAKAIILVLAAGGLAACAQDPQTTFAGSLKPLAGTCDAGNRAVLVRHGNAVQFTPQDGVLVLEGTVAADGHIAAAAKTVGMDRAAYELSFQGSLSNDLITGFYVTPRCRYAVTMRAAPP